MGTSTGRASGFASRAFVAAAFVVVLLVPNVCDAASALKVAENKLREKGLLHDVESSGARHVEDVSIDFGVDDPPVSSAEGKFRAAREILEGHEYTGSRRKTHAVRTLKEVLAAEPEHREAMTLLGRAFQTGDGADQDDARSLELFKRAAALGDPGAHNELGFAYSVGWVSRVISHTEPIQCPQDEQALPTNSIPKKKTKLTLPIPIQSCNPIQSNRLAPRSPPRSRFFTSTLPRWAAILSLRWRWGTGTFSDWGFRRVVNPRRFSMTRRRREFRI